MQAYTGARRLSKELFSCQVCRCFPGVRGTQLPLVLVCLGLQCSVFQLQEPAPEHIPCFTPQVLGLLVWSLIAATTYHLHAAYGWVMFVSLFFWILTLLFFVTYLLQLHQKFYMIPWPLVVRSQEGVRGDPKRETFWKDSLGRLQALLGLWDKVLCILHSAIVSFCPSIV